MQIDLSNNELLKAWMNRKSEILLWDDDDSYFSKGHSSRCADRISVCTISVPDYDFMAAQCAAKMFSCPPAKCYCDRVNWSHGLGVPRRWVYEPTIGGVCLCRPPHALSSPLPPLPPLSPRLTLCLAPDRIPGVSIMLILSRTWFGIWAHWNLVFFLVFLSADRRKVT